MTWIHGIDPEFGKRLPPNRLERIMIAAVEALTRLLAWLGEKVPTR